MFNTLHQTHVDGRTMRISRVEFGSHPFAVHTVMEDGSLEWGHYFKTMPEAVNYIEQLRWAS